ncbi:OLC1v1038024C1 [Oldenlandia corymbosa var. corymbosa]|uniref:OLC1v1038024C1 n=1 Tax=Oldenlandia corymbosa var. corymbosa TaxID=529605 RepID=A0AAV1CYY0_OLDCO|nr:OLC1v1038024C1 [Oldenlandia corymbosa var. corymbosa]
MEDQKVLVIVKLIDAALFTFFLVMSLVFPVLDALMLLPPNIHHKLWVAVFKRPPNNTTELNRFIWAEFLFQWPLRNGNRSRFWWDRWLNSATPLIALARGPIPENQLNATVLFYATNDGR